MNDSLRRAFAALHKARSAGYASACCFLLTALLVIDGLQALVRDDFSRIDLPLGGQVLMSGAMPLQAKKHTDIVTEIEGLDGLEFIPLEDFRSFWMGSHMWRAKLDASAVTEPGQAVLTIVDMVPAKSTSGSGATITVQNPNQVYAVTVWASPEAMQAAHFSLARRLTGLSAFIWAALSVICALGIGAWHAFLNNAAHNALAREGIFVIHGLQKTDAGYQAIFVADAAMELRQPMSLLNLQGVEQGMGVLCEYSAKKYRVLFPPDGAVPRYGWLLRYTPEPRPASEREEPISA